MGVRLTDKVLAFCDHYAEIGNGYQAAIKAGYSEGAAGSRASRLLADPKVHDEIQRRRDARAVAVGVSKEDVLRELWRVGSFDIGKLYDSNGKPKKIHQIDEDTRRALLQHNEIVDEEGNLRLETINANKMKALELVAKHLGMLDKDAGSNKANIAFNFNFEQPAERQPVPEKFINGVDTTNGEGHDPAVPRVFKISKKDEGDE